ncbi:MAG TPA: phosphodiesterase [Thermohalobaculum sp.]|nr:phosphodiesterase [Thermohalobaculum sp.]
MKFIILTDPHFVPPGELLFGLDPKAHLARAVEVINRDHPEIAFVVLLGDLTNRGEVAAYASLSETLGLLNAPLIPLTGNHDSRVALCEALPQASRDSSGFMQALQVFDAASILTLDTLDEGGGTGAGFLCPDRLAFLETALAEAPADRPLLVFQHHPPFDTGLKTMDRIKLRNPEDEWAIFERTRRPDYLFMGHVHRPISGSWRGIPFHIQRGVSHQVGFDFANTDGITGSYEGPDYALVEVGSEGVVIHQRPFLFIGPHFMLNDAAARQATRRLE